MKLSRLTPSNNTKSEKIYTPSDAESNKVDTSTALICECSKLKAEEPFRLSLHPIV